MQFQVDSRLYRQSPNWPVPGMPQPEELLLDYIRRSRLEEAGKEEA